MLGNFVWHCPAKLCVQSHVCRKGVAIVSKERPLSYKYAAALILSLSLASTAHAEQLDLQCIGGGSANQSRTKTAQFGNSYSETAWGTMQSREAVGFSDQADFRLAQGTAQIRMPRSMLPPIHGGDDGWMNVKSLQVSDSEITGSVSVNPINRPKLRIDRRTGILTINGKAGSYTVECRAYDPRSTQRRF